MIRSSNGFSAIAILVPVLITILLIVLGVVLYQSLGGDNAQQAPSSTSSEVDDVRTLETPNDIDREVNELDAINLDDNEDVTQLDQDQAEF